MKLRITSHSTILTDLNFELDDKYKCECYLMDSDNYCLRIYDNDKELYSVWFDSSLSFVTGNDEYYTPDNINHIVDEAFNVIKAYI